ncbi:response regulator [Chrysiogenes arsenatis]|uniref:response regulator n=1 Tax=Chrysiogenes arsenatis TaxID=309797 RepID=UPI0004156F2A|nr:response regulator [Chrysiogenes arsenatis]
MAKILIVDDSIVARMSLKSAIPKDQGHEITEAKDGASALETFRQISPDVTFLDLTMPDMNGLDVLHEIMQEHPTANVIVVTADIQKRVTERAMQLGAFALLKKPPVKESVQDALRQVLAQ